VENEKKHEQSQEERACGVWRCPHKIGFPLFSPRPFQAFRFLFLLFFYSLFFSDPEKVTQPEISIKAPSVWGNRGHLRCPRQQDEETRTWLPIVVQSAQHQSRIATTRHSHLPAQVFRLIASSPPFYNPPQSERIIDHEDPCEDVQRQDDRDVRRESQDERHGL
jgi:hypothetical protein